MDNTNELMVLGIVLVVALAGAYASTVTGGTILVIEGRTQTSFDRPLGNKLQQIGGYTNSQCYVNAEGQNVCCYEEAGKWLCEDGSGASFGPSESFREGNEKMYYESPSKPGIILG